MPLLLNIVLEVLTIIIREEKEIKGDRVVITGREEQQLQYGCTEGLNTLDKNLHGAPAKRNKHFSCISLYLKECLGWVMSIVAVMWFLRHE